jgi:hypothetical protein
VIAAAQGGGKDVQMQITNGGHEGSRGGDRPH